MRQSGPSSRQQFVIGKTLNDKNGCPWLTPMLNPVSSENYHFVRFPDLGRRASFSGRSGFAGPELSKAQNERGAHMGAVNISSWQARNGWSVYKCMDEDGISHKVLQFQMLKFLLWLVALWVTWGIKVQFQVACLLKEPAFASLLLTWLLARREVMKAGGITKSQRFSEELHSPTSSEDDDNPHPITILGHE
ncbi:hypothetical protein OIU78_026001 [Salix suchowensis]|nr:hypothetical protein OIU78_026001 [Salix suchowensis]